MKIIKRRRFQTIGLLRPDVSLGSKIENSSMRTIHEILIQNGFRSTIWQFIYCGQQAGVVKSVLNGNAELHVRFYDDHIFTELEIGRASIAHFLYPIYGANLCIRDIALPFLSTREAQLFEHWISDSALTLDEKRIHAVRRLDDAALVYPQLCLATDSGIGFGRLLHRFGWRGALGSIAFVLAGVAVANVSYAAALPATIALVVTFALPHIGRP